MVTYPSSLVLTHAIIDNNSVERTHIYLTQPMEKNVIIYTTYWWLSQQIRVIDLEIYVKLYVTDVLNCKLNS